MKYRIVKRSYSDGEYYFVVQRKFWFFPWNDDEGYSTNQYYFHAIEHAQQRVEDLMVRKLPDEVVKNY